MGLDITGKAALVTGGGSGICRAFVNHLLSKGCNVVIADLSLAETHTSDEESYDVSPNVASARSVFIKTDVTIWSELRHAFDCAIQEFGRLDIVCPGAGVLEPVFSRFWNFDQGTDTDGSSSYKTIDINFVHPIRATQLAIDFFRRQKLDKANVVLVSSIAAQSAFLGNPLYVAGKHGISGFTRCLSELEPLMGIRVNAVAPGNVKTPIWTNSTDSIKFIDEALDCWVSVEDVAQTMLQLITDDAHVGGTILEVGADSVRSVQLLNDPGPRGRGHTISNLEDATSDVRSLIEKNFGN